MNSVAEKRAAFRALHESGCFVLPNPWNVGSAVLLAQLGFRALASTSAGLSFDLGRPDAIESLTLDEVLAHLRALVDATPLPLSADFQNGYASDSTEVERNVAACLATGVAGFSIEDASGADAAPLYPLDVALERLDAACRVRDREATRPVLTARCEAFLVGVPDAADVALTRLAAYARAGADCLFAPGSSDPGLVAELVAAVAPKPLNVIAFDPRRSVADWAALGVRRVSIGSGLARAAWGEFRRVSEELAGAGSVERLANAATFTELNAAFGAARLRCNPR